MSKKYLPIITKEVLRVEEFARKNPLHFQNDPEHINAIIFLALEHPDWHSNEILDWYQQKKVSE